MNREPDRLQSIAYKELDMTEHAQSSRIQEDANVEVMNSKEM